MPLFLIVAIIGITCAVIWGPKNQGESDAMKVCQLSHSHDVCFQTLNR